jgi:amino acid transporter
MSRLPSATFQQEADTQTANLILIVAIVIAGAITLPLMAHSGRRSAVEVFVRFEDNGAGWPKGWSYMMGFLQGAYTYSATGLLTSMAEEVKRPEYTLPRALVYGNMLNAVLGLAMILPILFTLGDITSILSSATGQPLGEIYLLATGKEAAAFILFFCSKPVSCF